MLKGIVVTFLFSVLSLNSLQARKKMHTPLQSAIVIDAATGGILYEHRADALTYPASLTKMMTLMILFDAINAKRIHMHTLLPVSMFATQQMPSKLGLRVGDSLTVREALMGLITKSANDAAVAIAEGLAGSEEAFAHIMNRTARRLGMRNTVFKNASGLPHPGQRTTARDMAILSQALIKNYQKYYRFFKETSFTFKGKTHKNHNKLLEKVPGVDGIKTGFVNASGFNLAASCIRNNHRIIAVVMGGKTGKARDMLMTNLINQTYQYRPPQTMEDLVRLAMAPAPEDLSPSVTPTLYQPENEAWMIQVGSFATLKQAENAAATGYMSLAAVYDASIKVSKSPRKKRLPYRAYLEGFSKTGAQEACHILRQQKKSCLVVPPHRAPRFYVAMN